MVEAATSAVAAMQTHGHVVGAVEHGLGLLWNVSRTEANRVRQLSVEESIWRPSVHVVVVQLLCGIVAARHCRVPSITRRWVEGMVRLVFVD